MKYGVLVIIAFIVPLVFAAKSPLPFNCSGVLDASITYHTLIEGASEGIGTKNLDVRAKFHLVRTFSNPVAFGRTGAFYSGRHAADSNRIDVREVATGRLAYMFKLSPDFAIQSLSDDGRWAVALNMPRSIGKQNTNIIIIDAVTGAMNLDFHLLSDNDLSWAWLGTDLIRIGTDGKQQVYRLRTGGPALLMSTPAAPERPPDIEPRFILTPDLATWIATWPLSIRAPWLNFGSHWKPFASEPPQVLAGMRELSKLQSNLAALAKAKYSFSNWISPSGRWLVLKGTQGLGHENEGGNFESFVDVFDIQKARLHRRFYIPARNIDAIAFSADETEFAWAGLGVLEVVALSSEEKVFSDVRQRAPLNLAISNLAFSGSDKLLFKDQYGNLRWVTYRPASGD